MELPRLDTEKLTSYLAMREMYLKVLYVDLDQVGLSVASREVISSLLTALWAQVRELHRLRLVFLGLPAPSISEWRWDALQEATSDPKAWAENHRQAVMLSFETQGMQHEALLADPIDRVTAGYRDALASD